MYLINKDETEHTGQVGKQLSYDIFWKNPWMLGWNVSVKYLKAESLFGTVAKKLLINIFSRMSTKTRFSKK